MVELRIIGTLTYSIEMLVKLHGLMSHHLL